ncbi:MAG: hypothetical protein SGPRY_013318, partial [Prymnesium sp.]
MHSRWDRACRLPEQWSNRLVSELRGVNSSALLALQAGLSQALPAFVFDEGCAFDLFLMELARRLHTPGGKRE